MLVAGYESGDLSRAAYCKAHGLSVTTLEYYRRRLRPAGPPLIEVDLQSPVPAHSGSGSVAVVLGNGRRIEIGWADLALISDHSQSFCRLLGWLEEA